MPPIYPKDVQSVQASYMTNVPYSITRANHKGGVERLRRIVRINHVTE